MKDISIILFHLYHFKNKTVIFLTIKINFVYNN